MTKVDLIDSYNLSLSGKFALYCFGCGSKLEGEAGWDAFSPNTPLAYLKCPQCSWIVQGFDEVMEIQLVAYDELVKGFCFSPLKEHLESKDGGKERRGRDDKTLA